MATKFNSSDFRNKAEFQFETRTQDAYGAIQSKWKTRTKAGARIFQVSMRESVAAGIEVTEDVLRLTVKYTRSTVQIGSTDSVLVNGGIYSIIQVENNNNNARNRFITFVVRRVQGD